MGEASLLEGVGVHFGWILLVVAVEVWAAGVRTGFGFAFFGFGGQFLRKRGRKMYPGSMFDTDLYTHVRRPISKEKRSDLHWFYD
eukprot:1391880-Amorphochlora_amoeboformis.AAC.1